MTTLTLEKQSNRTQTNPNVPCVALEPMTLGVVLYVCPVLDSFRLSLQVNEKIKGTYRLYRKQAGMHNRAITVLHEQ